MPHCQASASLMNTGAPAAPPPVTGARLFKANQQHRHRRRHFLVCLLFRGSVHPPLPISPQRLHVNMQQGTRDGYDRDVIQSRVGRTSLFRPLLLLTSPAVDSLSSRGIIHAWQLVWWGGFYLILILFNLNLIQSSTRDIFFCR